MTTAPADVSANASLLHDPLALPSFFLGGFECSTHRLGTGRRLDLATATRHLEFADADYRRLAAAGMHAARDGLSWPRIEVAAGRYDFASFLPLLRAARRHGVHVIWDLLHFGWPDDIDVFRPAFVERFAAFARAVALLMADDGCEAPWISPVNEISFLAWAGGEVGALNPFAVGRGFELKCQLARASIAAIDAVRDVLPAARIVVHDPAYHVLPRSDDAGDCEEAEVSRLLQFQGCDLLTGKTWPQFGGRPDHVDLFGVNFYPWNQWVYGTAVMPGRPVRLGEPGYRPLSDILVEWQQRYRRPIYIGETGCEGEPRAAWLRTVCDEAAIAGARGAPVLGICLYPVVNFPGWDNDRHCHNGLWDYADDTGHREVHEPLAEELRMQQRRFAAEAGQDVRTIRDAPAPARHAHVVVS